MSWNEQTAKDRVAEYDYTDMEVDVADLTREMDFSNLGPCDVRRVDGAHLYADVPNFHLAVADAGGDKQKQKKLLRAASVLRRVQGKILADADVVPMQLQAARLHCLNHKPYGDARAAERATRSVVTAITLNSYLYEVFNPVFEEVRNFSGSVGVASGRSLVANIGFRGERELISLGTPANLGAKILGGADTINVTEEVYDLLPGSLQAHFTKDRSVNGTAVFQAKGLRWGRHPDLAEELGVTFDADRLRKTTEEYRDALPLNQMEVSDAEVLIDVGSLTERNSKRTEAAVLVIDVDGFTKYVQEAEEDEDIESLVRGFHMIRRELHTVVQNDYPGLVIQHQGDNVIGIVHLPPGDEHDRRCRRALDVALGVQSSMEHVLNQHLGDRKGIHLGVGVAIGQVLVTRLGTRGEREVVCLGQAVTAAGRLQTRSAGEETRVSAAIYEAAKEGTLKDKFAKMAADEYSAVGITFPRLDAEETAKAARANALAATFVEGGIRVQPARSAAPQVSVNPRPWSAGE